MAPAHTDAAENTDAADGIDSAVAWRLRLHRTLERHGSLVVVACLCLVLLGGWLSYGAFAAGGDERLEERTIEVWSVTGDLEHSATVQSENPVFPVGTQLSNEPLYYTAVAPNASGEYTARYHAEEGAARVDVSVTLVVQASEEGTVYWRDESPLASASHHDVGPGEPAAVAFDVDVEAVADRIEEIESGLGASAGAVEVFLEPSVSIDGEIAGDRHTAVETEEIALDLGAGTYAVESATLEVPHQRVESVPVESGSRSATALGGPLAAVLGMAGLAVVGLVFFRWKDPPPDELAWLEYRDDRETYAELLTTASLPDTVAEKPQATVDSLGELAQLAIDLEAPLVFEPGSNRYVAVHDGLRYVFEPPEPPVARESAVESAGGTDSTTVTIGGTDDPETGVRRANLDGEELGGRAGDRDERFETGSTPTVHPDDLLGSAADEESVSADAVDDRPRDAVRSDATVPEPARDDPGSGATRRGSHRSADPGEPSRPVPGGDGAGRVEDGGGDGAGVVGAGDADGDRNEVLDADGDRNESPAVQDGHDRASDDADGERRYHPWPPEDESDRTR